MRASARISENEDPHESRRRRPGRRSLSWQSSRATPAPPGHLYGANAVVQRALCARQNVVCSRLSARCDPCAPLAYPRLCLLSVSVSKPRRIHLASQCYVRGWADNGRVLVQDDDLSREPRERNVSSVGWRPGWWGPSREVAEQAEAMFQHLESKAAPILRGLESRWPLSKDDRATVSQFVAIHTVRTPAWREAYNSISMGAISEELGRQRWDPEVATAAVTEFIGDPLRVETLLKQIPRLASLFMSMHWTLVRFAQPWIASCDQPVICVPRLPSWKRMPISAMPRAGFMETAEVRFPIDPWRILLLTWSPQPDVDPVDGEFRHAADINRSTREQADRDWFHRPGSRPPLLAGPVISTSCEPISYDLVPDIPSTLPRTPADGRRPTRS
jgi:hypothetical protein